MGRHVCPSLRAGLNTYLPPLLSFRLYFPHLRHNPPSPLPPLSPWHYTIAPPPPLPFLSPPFLSHLRLWPRTENLHFLRRTMMIREDGKGGGEEGVGPGRVLGTKLEGGRMGAGQKKATDKCAQKRRNIFPIPEVCFRRTFTSLPKDFPGTYYIEHRVV